MWFPTIVCVVENHNDTLNSDSKRCLEAIKSSGDTDRETTYIKLAWTPTKKIDLKKVILEIGLL